MKVIEKIKKELKLMAIITGYFFFCFIIFVVLKSLFLAQVNIEFYGLSAALFGAILMSKVVLLTGKTRLSKKFDNRPLLFEVLFKTLLFTLITMIVVFLEHVVHSYLEVYSLKLAFVEVFEHRDINQFFVVVICAFISLLVYHTFVGMLSHFGKDKMIHLFFKSKKP